MAASFRGFQSLIEHSPDAISLTDERGKIFYGSASNTKILGYRPEELVGRNCLDLIHPQDRAHARQKLREAVAGPHGIPQWAARVHHKNGDYSWVEITVSNLLHESEIKAMVVQQRNIDERKAYEAEAQRKADALALSNLRFEEFAYNAAHDLREPLRAISVFTKRLSDEMPLTADAKQFSEFILDGTARMSALIDDLLLFAHTGMLEPFRPIDLGNAVAQATRNLKLEIEASGAVVTVGLLPVVLSNEICLVRLFQNLISNAVKYRSKDPVEIGVSAERLGEHWVVRVSDNGVGIGPENQARVFLPFVRLASRDVRGTGLGLAVCRKIVEGLRGTLWVESTPGKGSTFSFTLPADAPVAV